MQFLIISFLAIVVATTVQTAHRLTFPIKEHITILEPVVPSDDRYCFDSSAVIRAIGAK